MPVTVRDRAPGIFMYTTTTPEGKPAFENLAAALLPDYSTHSATNPVSLNGGLKGSIALYVNRLGTPTDGPAPALGMPAPIPRDGSRLLHVRPLDVYVNGDKLPAENVVFAGKAPGIIIDQVNIVPATGTATGANSVRVCTQEANAVCSQDVTVFMSSTREYIAGNITDPGKMSDGKLRSLDKITGTAASDAGTANFTTSNRNFLVPAKGTTALALSGNDDWESCPEAMPVGWTPYGATRPKGVFLGTVQPGPPRHSGPII